MERRGARQSGKAGAERKGGAQVGFAGVVRGQSTLLAAERQDERKAEAADPRVARERFGVVPGGKRLLELVSARPQGALGEHGRVEGCARRAMGGVRRSTAVRGLFLPRLW